MDYEDNMTDPNGLPADANILDNAGELVGSLESANGQAGYLVVIKGVFFTKGIFLPMSALDYVSGTGIPLNLGKDEVGDSHFELPPTVTGTV